ncbi:hypothetical protein P171DRAFT_523914 [Karstenula rhodostoma CBS 690.94]|uniref:Nephrocystin 3-like N-terminal domain-containing protein n=1 Tax=Karstenula rhodostoma CBS 690.94 TaxID=1392251 RepID=A0A9P4U970_9PLEO|nr:hypothetical protein P171DRAFT_523914 [Karstenula rhodostoma CBS 690.94]
MDFSATFPQPPKAIKEALNDQREIEAFRQWKSHVGNDLHSTFGEEREYHSQRAVWKAPITQELETVLASAQQFDPSFDLKACTWDDLLCHIDASIELDAQKSKNNRLRRAVRNANADVQMLNSLVSIIPDEKGLSLLRGGLSIIFQSWNQRLETREHVLGLLTDIIELFVAVSAKRRLLADDDVLRALLFDLYGVLLDAVRELISILLRAHKGNWMQRVRKQLPPHEAQQVERITTTVENMKTQLTNRMKVLSLERDVNTYKNTQAIKTEVQATRYHVNNVEVDVNNISHNTRATQQTAEKIYLQSQDIRTQLTGVGTSINNATANLDRYVEASVARQFERWKQEFNSGLLGMQKENQDLVGMIQTSIYQFMGEKMNAERLGWLLRPSPQPQPLAYKSIDVPLDQLTHVLNVDPTPMLAETQSMLRLTHAMQPQGLEKVRSLISAEQFSSWMGLPFPNVLLVDGHCRDQGQGRTSPLSIFCASLAATLAQTGSNIVLHFFCGHHSNPQYDAVSGPAGILRSLITQLILYPNACTMPAVAMEQSMWEAVARHEVPALLALFEQILLSLPPSKTIYTILDNVSDYQGSLNDYARPTMHILQYLHRLADERRPGPRLKLLMTSANRTVDVPYIVNQAGGEYIALHMSPVEPSRYHVFRCFGPTRSPVLE